MSDLREAAQQALEALVTHGGAYLHHAEQYGAAINSLRAALEQEQAEPVGPLDRMWQRLAEHQPFADERGYGEAWATMCRERTEAAAWAAWAAWAAADAAAWAAARAADAAAWAAEAWAADAVARAAAAEARAAAAEADAIEWIKKAEGE